MSNLEDFPEIHKAVTVYMENFKLPPTNATQLIKWCKTNGLGDIKYADANKYLRIQRGDSGDSANKNNSSLNESRSRPQSMAFSSASSSSSQKSSPSLKPSSVRSVPDNTSFFNNSKLNNHEMMLDDSNVIPETDSIDDLETRSNHSSATYNSNCNVNENNNNNNNANKRIKPWLRLKPNWSLEMSKNNTSDEELKKWLKDNNFEQFEENLNKVGVMELNDLKILKTEDEIKELAGPDGISMGVIYRRKFINCVLNLINHHSSPSDDLKDESIEVTNHNNNDTTNVDNTLEKTSSIHSIVSNHSDNQNSNSNSNINQKRNSLKMSKDEERSLTKLVQQIRFSTQQLQSCKTNLGTLKKQFDDSHENLNETFEKAMSSLIIRRKQLEEALNKAELETIVKLEERIKELTKFAQTLLQCKGQVETKLKNSAQGIERDQYVINEVNKSLENAPKEEVPYLDIIFDQGNTSLIHVIENYGSVAVGKRKIGKSPAPLPLDETS